MPGFNSQILIGFLATFVLSQNSAFAVECDASNLRDANPWKKGSPVCTIPVTKTPPPDAPTKDTSAKPKADDRIGPKSNSKSTAVMGMGVGMGMGMGSIGPGMFVDPNRFPEEQMGEAIETFVSGDPAHFESIVNALKADRNYTHPLESQLREYNQHLSRLSNDEAKFKYTMSMPKQVQAAVKLPFMRSQLLMQGVPDDQLEILLKHQDSFSDSEYNEMAFLILNRVSEHSPKQMEKAKSLMERLRKLDPGSRTKYCLSGASLMSSMQFGFSKANVQLLAEAFSLQEEPKEKCPQMLFGPSFPDNRAGVFEQLKQKGYITGEEKFLKKEPEAQALKTADVRSSVSKNPGTGFDYQSCKMKEIEGAMRVEINAYKEGEAVRSRIENTSAKCSVQVYGSKKDGQYGVTVKVWNSKGELVLDTKEKLADSKEIIRVMKGDYQPKTPRGLVLTNISSPKRVTGAR